MPQTHGRRTLGAGGTTGPTRSQQAGLLILLAVLAALALYRAL